MRIFQREQYLDRVINGKARPSHHYPTSFSRDNYIVPSFKLTKSKYRITIRAPRLWNIILNTEEKLTEKPAIF